MAKYEVFIKLSAAKEVKRIRKKKDRQRIVAHIQELTENPRPPGFQKLSGADKYRIQRGNYRIVYSINDDELVVQVVRKVIDLIRELKKVGFAALLAAHRLAANQQTTKVNIGFSTVFGQELFY